MEKKIIITGADGFVGRNLIPKLIEKKYKLLLIGSNKVSLDRVYNEITLNFSYIDLNQSEMEDAFLKFKPDFLINLAAYSTSSDSFDNLKKLYTANILYLGKILDALKHTGLQTFVYVGSSTEFLNGSRKYDPAYLYSATKSAGREILNYYSKTYGFKTITITPYNIYGGDNTQKKIIDLLISSLKSQSAIDITLGNQSLDFIHINDIVDLFINVIEKEAIIPNNTDFHAGTGVATNLKDIASILERISGKQTNINWGGVPYRKRDTMYSVANISLQKQLLNWEPSVSIESGLEIILKQNK